MRTQHLHYQINYLDKKLSQNKQVRHYFIRLFKKTKLCNRIAEKKINPLTRALFSSVCSFLQDVLSTLQIFESNFVLLNIFISALIFRETQIQKVNQNLRNCSGWFLPLAYICTWIMAYRKLGSILNILLK